ncbi:MAG: methyltransferase domain-containing protein [Candidatus Binataceae bacterium]
MEKSVTGVFDPAGFSNVDASGQTSTYVAFLEQNDALLRALSRARYTLLELRPGNRVIDVGCGLGDNARELASLVGSRGRVVALDASETMVDEARKRSVGSNLPIDFVTGDAHALKFEDNTFDACWVERVLEHLADPARAIAELVRVAKPGGRIVVFEPDHETLVIDAADRAATSSVVRTLADGIRCSWIGRALYGLFRANGLQDVKVIPTPLVSHSLADANAMLRLDAAASAAVQRGLISEKAASQWLDDLKERHEIGRFFGAMLCFTASGRKP